MRDTDDAEGKRLRGIMERQLAVLVRMTDDLLEVSRITRGKIELRRTPADLRTIINAALETSRPLIAQARHVVELRMDPMQPLPLLADTVRLSQVFSNLLNNAVGRGSEFIVQLQLADASCTDGIEPVLSTFDGVPFDIVVTDDSRENADSLAQMLRLAGHVLRVTYDGESCLAALAEQLPDLVLLDLGMPGLDGYETCRRIRERHGHDVRVLAVSGWGQAQDVARAAIAGFDGHLVKPVDPALLAAGMEGLGLARSA